MTQESLTEKLAKYLRRPIEKTTRERARLHLLDWLGCVAGARDSKVAALLVKSPICPVESASWLGNVLEMDDIHRTAILHPGPVIWQPVIDAAEDASIGMDQVLDSAVRGYEAMIAIGATFDAHHYAHYHPTATAGAFGAAAAVASIHSLNRKQLCDALGNAGSMTGGLWQMRHEAVMTKQLHTASAARNGYFAAFMARSGMSGPASILEGPQGLYAATCDTPKPMEFPKRWRIWDVSFKPWGACRHAHPAIDAALALKAKLGALDGDILVETYTDAITFCDRPNPQTVTDAKFSLQHAVAVVVEKGAPELADFEPNAIQKFSAARKRVKVQEATDISRRYPEHYGARISCGSKSLELTDTLGDPERPMNETQIIDKARALMAWGGLSKKQADKAVKLALEGDDPAAIYKMLGKWLG